jgi:hypothetical protein
MVFSALLVLTGISLMVGELRSSPSPTPSPTKGAMSEKEQAIIFASCKYGVLMTEVSFNKRDGTNDLGKDYPDSVCYGLLKEIQK